MGLAPLTGNDPMNEPLASDQSTLRPVDPTMDTFRDRGRAETEDISVQLEIDDPEDQNMMRNESQRFKVNITNLGGVDDTYDLTVEGAGDGWKAILTQSAISLASGASGLVGVDILSPRSTFDGKQFDIKATSQNSSDHNHTTLDIILDTDYMVDVGFPKEGNETSVGRGKTAIYQIDFFNSGDEPDSYWITYSTLPRDWTASVVPTEVDEVPGNSDPQPVELRVTVPQTAEENEFALVRLIVTSKGDERSHIDSDQETNTSASDGRTYGVTLDAPNGNETTIIPGAGKIYDIRITNDGNETDTFQLSRSEATDGWTAVLSNTTIEIEGNSEDYVELEVTAPEGAQEDDTMVITVSAYSDNRPEHDDEMATTTDIRLPVRDMELVVDHTALTTAAGTGIRYYLNLTNKGTDPDDFTLEIIDSGNSDWSFTLETYHVGELGVDETIMLFLRVKPNYDVLGGSQEVVDVIATSDNDPAVNATISTTTSVEEDPDFFPMASPIYQTVFPGGEVIFNVTVQNTGNVVDSYTLSISADPTGFNSEFDITYLEEVLTGGNEQARITVEVEEGTSTTTHQYEVTITSENDGTLIKKVSFSVEVIPFAELELIVPTTTGAVDPGMTHDYPFTIENNGNSQENLTLVVENLPANWQARFFQDTTLVTGEFILDADAQATLTLKVTTASDDLADSHDFNLKVISGVSPSVEEGSDLSLSVNEFYAFTLTPDGDTLNSVQTNTTVTRQFTLQNTGNIVDYYQPTPPTWPTDWTGDVLPTSSFSLQPGETRVLTVNVNVPLTALGGWNNLTPSVTSTGLPGQGSTYDLNLEIPFNSKVGVSITDWIDSIYAGQTSTAAFKFEVRNLGNGPDNITLTVAGSAAAWLTYPDPGQIKLGPGGTKEIIVDLDVPISALDDQYTITLTVTSGTDETESKKTSRSFQVYGSSDQPSETEDDDDDGGFLPAPSLVGLVAVTAMTAMMFALFGRRR